MTSEFKYIFSFCQINVCLLPLDIPAIVEIFIFRAEVLKKKLSPTTKAPPATINNPLNKPTQGGKVVPPLAFGAFLDSDEEKDSGQIQDRPRPSGQQGPTGPTGLMYVGPKGYTKDEIDVLR